MSVNTSEKRKESADDEFHKEAAVSKGINLVLDGTYKGLTYQLIFSRIAYIIIIISLILSLWLIPLKTIASQIFIITLIYSLIVTVISAYWWLLVDKANRRLSSIETELLSAHAEQQGVLFFQALLTNMRHDNSKNTRKNILIQLEPIVWWLIAQTFIYARLTIL